MKYITKTDSIWHDSNGEMPSTTSKVEFMDIRGNIHNGRIVVDMAGHYALLEEGGWSSFEIMKKWRFAHE